MSTKYAKALEETRKYQAYVESLKPRFGLWDDCDPVARAILGLVETQNSLAAAIDDDPYVQEDGEPRHADIPKALEFRIKAALQLLEVLLVHPETWKPESWQERPLEPYVSPDQV